jgi:hypothetical protein
MCLARAGGVVWRWGVVNFFGDTPPTQERARATLDAQINEERRSHKTLLKMIETMKQQDAAAA